MSTFNSDKSITKKKKKIPKNYRKFLSSKPTPWEQEDLVGLAERRELLGLVVSFFSPGFCFFCLGCSILALGSIFDFGRGLFLLTLALIFGPLGPL